MLAFDFPWMFAALVLPILVHYLLPGRVEVRPAVRIPFLSRIQGAGGSGEIVRTSGKGISLVVQCLIWFFVVVALARPQWYEKPIERTLPTRDLLLLIDLSGSMDQKDFTNESGQKVDRLTAVKGVLDEFLKDRQGDRVGLVVFGDAPFLQVPFTTDLELCRQLMEETAVGMAGPKTAFGDAIGLGIQLFSESDAPAKTIIALTDGNDTGSQVPPPEAARVARDRGITIYTVAMGNPETVGEERLDQETLREVSKVAGGEYFLALNRDELSKIYQRLDEIETTEVKTVSYRPRDDLYYVPLSVAVLLGLASVLWSFRSRRDSVDASNVRQRLRVNARTFELEAVDP
ncbi:von Willebrand factor type A domain protein [Thalassoglobus neptunius]|uniref:von Willebrand factor type A domain protein n=1 Tax=Thalassoglobus neptunius TaxID=1938619 RepID=A0A5C5VYN8_9PLAN|nr:VWA domain-containing protein [Thalassoglobus neptunius]TWT43524.1 von Willebrand factor type A domain protein [Thalassoglobus neptunius]